MKGKGVERGGGENEDEGRDQGLRVGEERVRGQCACAERVGMRLEEIVLTSQNKVENSKFLLRF